MWEYALMGLIGFGSGFFGMYIASKHLVNSHFFMQILDDLFDEAMNNEVFQKRIYVIGALLGNGIKQGVGLSPSRGKMKFQDIITQAIAGMILPKITGAAEGKLPWETG